MKKFIDDKGTFKIFVPTTWKYSKNQDEIHIFNEYEVWKHDSFQISVKEIDSTEKTNYFFGTQYLPKIKIGNLTYAKYPDGIDDEFTTKIWKTVVDNEKITFTFTSPNVVDPDLDSRTDAEKQEIALKAIDSFILHDRPSRKKEIESFRFEMFLQGVGATSAILDKAIKNKAFIESTCILASQIDAILRIGIILEKQIKNNNSDIELEWIYQGVGDKKKSEKEIYKKLRN